MVLLTSQHTERLHELLQGGMPPPNAIPQAIGETYIYEQFWRFYSDTWPSGGITQWNFGSSWKRHWEPFLPPSLFSFGEDIFGNQLVLMDGFDNALLWNHENGEIDDLLVGPSELLDVVLTSGIDWIDFYADGSLGVAREAGVVPYDMHLHWTMPLILGGRVARENQSLVQREPHLIGHAQLWSQVGGLPSGTRIIPRQPS